MTDVISKNKRSEIMRTIRSKDTKIEIAFRKFIWNKGFRYSKNSTKYFGKPDIALPKYKTVIFIDSCFWHGCKKHCRLPSTRKNYWLPKIERNKQRDKEVNNYYKKLGWKIIRIWEHNLRRNKQKIVKHLDSLPASSAGKSEKVRKIQTLPAFASSFAKATADKKATDGQAIRNRNGIETAGKSGFE